MPGSRKHSMIFELTLTFSSFAGVRLLNPKSAVYPDLLRRKRTTDLSPILLGGNNPRPRPFPSLSSVPLPIQSAARPWLLPRRFRPLEISLRVFAVFPSQLRLRHRCSVGPALVVLHPREWLVPIKNLLSRNGE